MITFEKVSKVYKGGVEALHGATATIEKGEFVFLVGPSGSGKSTMLRLINREETADKGRLFVAGQGHRPPVVVAGALPAPQHRLHLPGLQAADEQDGLRERRLRPRGHRPAPPRGQGPGARHPRAGRPRLQGRQPARGAVGRRAAAGVDRPGVRQPAADPAGRRAHGQPRPGHVGGHHAPARPHQPHGHDGGHGHPRPLDRRHDAAPGDRARDRARSSATRFGGCTSEVRLRRPRDLHQPAPQRHAHHRRHRDGGRVAGAVRLDAAARPGRRQRVGPLAGRHRGDRLPQVRHHRRAAQRDRGAARREPRGRRLRLRRPRGEPRGGAAPLRAQRGDAPEDRGGRHPGARLLPRARRAPATST